jgi:SpoU rRNA methylase family enzyme
VKILISVETASGKVTLPFQIELGNLGSIPFVEKNLPLQFDPQKMFQISDTQPGTIFAQVLADETEIAHANWAIEVLPANYWKAGQHPANYAAMASFVQPNHPTIRTILTAAVSDLKARGKAASLSGYQNLNHVEDIAQSIYNAVRALNITYSNPPASWAGSPGQKIRTAQEIVEEGVGTCLDTATLFASCLEQAGLAPVLAIVPGHAFVGYWTAESQRDQSGKNPIYQLEPTTAIEQVANYLDAGFIKLFETVVVCEDAQFDFESAVQAGRKSLEDAKAFSENVYLSHLVNIKICRHAAFSIFPMPARFVEPNGEVTIVEYTPSEVSLDILRKSFEEGEGRQGNTLKINVPVNVKNWLDGLLDLSLRNPLINMKPRKNSVKLLLPPEALGIVEDALQDDKVFSLTHQTVTQDKQGQLWLSKEEGDRGGAATSAEREIREDLAKKILHTDTDPNSLVTKMRTIYSEAKTFTEETGSNGLYLALGTLVWKVNGAEIESPLILVPVSLSAKNRNTQFSLSLEESGVTPNFSLVEKLKTEIGLSLPNLANLETDNYGVDVDGTLQYVREELIKAGHNDFRVDPRAVLGIFNFSSFRLWKDLLDNWQKFERNPLVKHLIHTPNEPFIEPVATAPENDLDALIAQLPIPADGSQVAAVAKAAAGHTFILQGPPGTGKSQTITNLLAHALDKGLRVLFVAEKKDALDVVKERMDASGIGAFSLDLHDKGSTSKAVRDQLDEVIDIMVNPDKTGYAAALADYEAALGPLRNYREQLHKKGTLGESIYSAKDEYLVIDTPHVIEIEGETIANLTPELKANLLASSKDIAALGPNTGDARKNPWSLSSSVDKLTSNQLEEVKKLSISIDAKVTQLTSNGDFKEFLTCVEGLDDLKLLSALRIQNLPISAIDFGMTTAGKEQIQFAIKALDVQRAKLSEFDFSTAKLPKVDLDGLQNQVREALEANALMRALKIGKPIKSLNTQLGVDTGVQKDHIQEALDKLRELSDSGTKATKELNALAGLRFDAEPNLFTSDGVSEALAMVRNLETICNLARFSKGSSGLAQRVATSQDTALSESAAGLVDDLNELCHILAVDEQQLALWQGKQGFGTRFIEAAREWGRDAKEFGQSNLIRWNDMMVASKPFFDQNLRGPLNALLDGAVPFSEGPNALSKGIYKGLFENLLVQHGLHSFDGSSINNYIRRLETAHEALRERLPRVLGAELLSRRGFDSSMKIGAIGDLLLAIKQGRNAMPLRTLLSRHWDIITRITPCILASPDSAVRFIDPNFEAFDLVVFDEASQIRVANSIGALGRAKSAVVVGDSKQMPPTSVAQSKGIRGNDSEEDDEEDLYLIEAESILEKCVNTRMPEIMLNWHYRSEDESLIAFSNQEYYESKLSTFPTANLGDADRRLEFKLIKDGQFMRAGDFDVDRKAGESKEKLTRTNPQEAKAIVAEIVRRVNDPSTADDTIGVVTLNTQQREYIKSLLNDSKDAKLTEVMKNGIGADAEGKGGVEIFVKNLETVQGSERDVILFSVAFSTLKNNRDKLPLSWGPLTNAGGHKRLNVAITRARKAVVIFCSFEPHVLVSKNPSSRGLADFGAYLAMAANTSSNDLASLATREEKQDRHRNEVLQALRQAGLTAFEEIGLSDFKVDIAIADPKKPGKAVLGILLDGRRWNDRTTVSDRDSLPVQLLTNRMGWPAIERIWTPTWIRDQSGEIERIKATFEEARKITPAKRAAATKASAKAQAKPVEPLYTKRDVEDEDQRVNPVDQMLSSIPEWHQAQPTILGSQEYLNYISQPRIRAEVNNVVKQLADIEGPVSYERVGKFVAACFDFNRVPAARVAAINSVISKDFARDQEGFLYPIGKSAVDYHEWRWSELGEGRVASEISLTEMANAMADVCKVAGGVRFEQLVKETAKVFGFTRQTKDTVARFQAAVKWGVELEQLADNGEYVTAII